MEIIIGLIAIAAVIVALGQCGVLDRILTTGRIEPVDFATLRLPNSPNTHLVAPKDLTGATPHDIAPQFQMPAKALAAKIEALAAKEPRVNVIWRSDNGLELQFVERTKWIRWPDIISVRIVPVDADHSTLALYSRSIYGHSDFGVNKARVNRWLTALRST